MRHVINGEKWLHYLGGIVASYLSDIHVERLAARDTTECRLGMIFFTWCIVELDCFVNLCQACIISIVANDIIHTGRKMISWIWRVCDITTKSKISDHI